MKKGVKYNENSTNILNNRNIDKIQDQKTITKGIIVKRANLRSFPTETSIYTDEKKAFDRFQESELHVNTQVLIIHESKDGIWNFVISSFYAGWVKKENIAIATSKDIDFFIKNNSFGVITESMIKVEDTILDMSVCLPYIGETEKGYNLILPKRKENGYIAKKQIIIEKDKAHIGYLPYTAENVSTQALRYEGVNYSWGGKDIGVDCSSFVKNIYKCFGFDFPRNTSSQEKSVGQIILLNNKTAIKKLELIKNNYPSLLYQQGHVMLYLGKKDNKYYIIHASSKEMKVVLSELTESSSYIKSINKIILVSN